MPFVTHCGLYVNGHRSTSWSGPKWNMLWPKQSYAFVNCLKIIQNRQRSLIGNLCIRFVCFGIIGIIFNTQAMMCRIVVTFKNTNNHRFKNTNLCVLWRIRNPSVFRALCQRNDNDVNPGWLFVVHSVCRCCCYWYVVCEMCAKLEIDSQVSTGGRKIRKQSQTLCSVFMVDLWLIIIRNAADCLNTYSAWI